MSSTERFEKIRRNEVGSGGAAGTRTNEIILYNYRSVMSVMFVTSLKTANIKMSITSITSYADEH